MRPCPKCGKQIKDHADQCKYCLQMVPTAEVIGVGSPGAPPSVVLYTTDQRKLTLMRAIQTQVGGDMRVESQSDFQAVLVFGRRPNHLLHFFIGLFPFRLWWIVWIVIALTTQERRRMITVNEFGMIETRDYR